MEYNDGFKRLEGHEAMKEIPESFDNEEPMAAAYTRRAARSTRKSHRLGAILAAVSAIALAGAVFFLSYYHFRGDGKATAAATSLKQTPKADARGGYTLAEVQEVAVISSATNDAAQRAAIAKATAANRAATATNAAANATNAVKLTRSGITGDGAVIDARTTRADNTLEGQDDSVDPAMLAATTKPDVIFLFPTDGDAIPENRQLNELAQEAVAEGADVIVTGYTDEAGSAAYNMALSDRRAEAVGDYLAAHGVPRNHIITEGMGETHAFATPALDRRAEVRLVM